MSSSLPHIQSVLVAFSNGALAILKFTSEFKGGLMDIVTAEERT
jgi:hypothetical protein